MKWIVELEGGEEFPNNAAIACKLAASGKLVSGLSEVFQRLEAALAGAKVMPEPEPAATPDRCWRCWKPWPPGEPGCVADSPESLVCADEDACRGRIFDGTYISHMPGRRKPA